MLKKSKIGQKLHEFERIRTILEMVKNFFSKIINWGGHNKLKCLEKNPNFGNYPPPTITVRRVHKMKLRTLRRISDCFPNRILAFVKPVVDERNILIPDLVRVALNLKLRF